MRFIISRTTAWRSSTSGKDEPPTKHAVRDGDHWVIDIPDLDALLQLVRTVEDRLIIDAAEDDFPPSIEIYDDYRE